MKAFKISANGIPVGVYTSKTVEDALEVYADDAGYESYETLKEKTWRTRRNRSLLSE